MIAPGSPLPAITQAVLIDGSSQPGYAGTPLIALGGQAAGNTDVLTIQSDVTLRGLVIDGFAYGAGGPSNAVTLQSVPLPGAAATPTASTPRPMSSWWPWSMPRAAQRGCC